MTPAARLAAAIEVLADIETRRRPVADALKDWGLSHRFAGAKDRAAIGNLVYDALRWRLSNAWIMDADAPRALVLATAGYRWRLSPDRLAEMMAGDPYAPEPLTEAERDRLTAPNLAAAPEHVRADVPEWIAPRLRRLFGADWVEEGAALALRPPLDLRVNRLKADRGRVLKALSRFGAVQTAHSPDGVRIAATEGEGRHPNVQVEPAFQKGWFEVQDEGSQLAALLVGAQPGEQVLDLCAGAGGKSLALAAVMANKGQIVATDRDRVRLAPIFDRLKRAGTRNVQVREAGAPLDDLAGRMDAVLIDAPCTGTGVWRRRPDAKWRVTERALEERTAEQRAILIDAARYVKRGGRVIYVTCSLLPEEDGDQVEAFLAEHHAFRAVPSRETTAGALGLVEPRAADDASGSVGLVLSPRRTATDGFFIASLKRELR
jgi:16S rRNA (cytosine967-C5)-methyltransferase